MAQFMTALSSPAKSLMARFRYSVKFSIVSVIFLLPLLLSLALLQYEYAGDIRHTRQELQGITLLGLMEQEKLALANAITFDRAFSSRYIQYNQASFQQLASVQVMQKRRLYLQSIESQQQQAFTQLLQLAQSVADYSKLELDLALDTSYLVTALVQSLPQLHEQILVTTKTAERVTDKGSFTPDTYIGLSNANQKLPALIGHLADNLRVSLATNPQIQQALQQQWLSLRQALTNYHLWVKSQILDPDEIQVTTSQLHRQSQRLNQHIADFHAKVLPVLQQQLQQRIDNASLKRKVVFAVSVVAVGLAIYLFIGMYLSVTDNINRLVSAVHDVADGKLATRVKVEGRDEMLDIAKDMNHMTANLENLVGRMSGAIGTLSDSAGALKQVTEQTIYGVQEQITGTELIAGSMSAMTGVANTVDQSSNVASQSAMEADKQAEQGMHLVASLQSVMEEMQQESQRSQEALNRLIEDSQNIGQVSSAINEIAEQTNLLALNAAIEAARAGEQGRGFAVVAEEVRTLAQRTQAQTSQIHSIINKLQQATEDTKVSMEQSREQMNLSVDEAAVVGDALQRISQVISTINQMSGEISHSASAQTSVTAEVAAQVKHIAQISERTRQGAEETDQSANNLLQVVATLKQQLTVLQKGA